MMRWRSGLLVVVLAVAVLALGVGLALAASPSQAQAPERVMISGVITSVASGQIVVKSPKAEYTVLITGDTWIFQRGQPVGPEALKVDQRVSVAGTKDASGKITARLINILADGRGVASGRGVGEVVKLEGDLLTVKGSQGEFQVKLTDKTAIWIWNDRKQGSRSDLKPGTRVMVQGKRTNGTIEAQRIVIVPADWPKATPGWDKPKSKDSGNTPVPRPWFGPGRGHPTT